MDENRMRFLHVASGTSTTDTIEAAGIPGLRSIWADPLYEGPVPAGLSDDELLEVRRRHLAVAEPRASEDPVNDLREWRAVLRRRASYDELVLWFEHDLFDQLNLIQLLTWVRDHVAPAPRVSLISIGSFPGRPAFKGLGELTAGELGPLFETRQPVDDRQFDLAQRAWLAFRAPEPESLDALRRDDSSALPYLAAAITRFMQEYPWVGTGLSRTERRLLELAGADGVSLAKAFPRMHGGEGAYHVTDATLVALAAELASTAPPLLVITSPGGANSSLLGSTVALTDAGRAVLAGERDRVATCGIDRWLGGVHLDGRGGAWRWNDAGQRIVAPA